MLEREIHLGSYARNIRMLHHDLFDRPLSDRGYIKDRKTTIEIPLSDERNRIVAYLRPGDLYLVGFETSSARVNAQRWFFPGEDGPDAAFAGTGRPLRIVSSYSRKEGLAIFYQTGMAGHDTPARDLGALQSSIETLARFDGARKEEDLKKPLADVCFLLSEALRFKTVFERMTLVCERNASFRYIDFKDDVSNWAAKSKREHIDNHKIWTFHRG